MNFKNTCRLCRYTTSNENELLFLFEHELNEKLRSIYMINVDFNEILPTKICTVCKMSIDQAAYLKKRFEDTNNYFYEYLRKVETTVE